MKIRSNYIRQQDLRRALRGIADVTIDGNGISTFRPRVHTRGFSCSLIGFGARHYRARQGNGGGHSATWDDHGIWMARLFDIDPGAHIETYRGRSDFLAQTRRAYEHYQRIIPGERLAPWLNMSVSTREFQWPPDLSYRTRVRATSVVTSSSGPF